MYISKSKNKPIKKKQKIKNSKGDNLNSLLIFDAKAKNTMNEEVKVVIYIKSNCQ